MINATTILEATMLGCFGAGWPIASFRMLRSRRVEGRGLLPTSLVLGGYLAGMLAKVLCACAGGGLAPIFWLYALNAVSVSFNLMLQWHFATDRPAILDPRAVGRAAAQFRASCAAPSATRPA